MVIFTGCKWAETGIATVKIDSPATQSGDSRQYTTGPRRTATCPRVSSTSGLACRSTAGIGISNRMTSPDFQTWLSIEYSPDAADESHAFPFTRTTAPLHQPGIRK